VINLSETGSEVAVLAEMLGQENDVADVSSWRCLVVHNSGFGRIQATQKRSPAGVAKRILTVSPSEDNAILCQSVNVRSFRQLVTVAPEPTIQIVNGDEKDIETPSLTLAKRREKQRQQSRPTQLRQKFPTAQPHPLSPPQRRFCAVHS
jgi:hypothetical protein